jgi:AraC family transcriptional regulator
MREVFLMNSHACLNVVPIPPRREPVETYASNRSIVTGHAGAYRSCGTSATFLADAVRILDEVRHAMELDLENAHAAAVRLVTFLADPAEAESAGIHGGLASWQRRKVDRYLREHLDRPLRLDELAEQVRLSVSHFCRAFTKTFGDTPHTYIVRLRLESAQKMMLTTREPLSQIALACGLADQAHLSKVFRRLLGETPSSWRRKNITEDQLEWRGYHSR